MADMLIIDTSSKSIDNLKNKAISLIGQMAKPVSLLSHSVNMHITTILNK